MTTVIQTNVTPPNTRTQTSHSLVILANGVPIGAVNQWQPDQSLDVNPVHEFGSFTGPFGGVFGQPYEMVPGNINGMTLRIQRYDIYTTQMERAFGTASLDMLSNDPGDPNVTGLFTLRERWAAPNAQNRYAIQYEGCWFTNIGRTLSTTDNRIVNVSAALVYTCRTRVALVA